MRTHARAGLTAAAHLGSSPPTSSLYLTSPPPPRAVLGFPSLCLLPAHSRWLASVGTERDPSRTLRGARARYSRALRAGPFTQPLNAASCLLCALLCAGRSQGQGRLRGRGCPLALSEGEVGGHPRGHVRWGPLAGVGPQREQAPSAAAARVVGAPGPGEGPGCSWDWAGSAGPLREPHRLLTSCGCAAWMTRSEFSELPWQGLERHRVPCTSHAHRQRGGQFTTKIGRAHV